MTHPNKKILKKLAEFNQENLQELMQQLDVTSEKDISLKRLHKLLRSKQATLESRLEACSLIMANQNKKSTKVLIEAFNDQNENISHAAMLALSTITSDKALEFLIKTLQSSPDDQKRWRAAYVLQGYFDNELAIDPLIDALNDKTQFIETRAQAAEGLGTLSATRATPILVANLHDTSLEVRAECIWALGQVGMDAAIIPELEKFIGDKTKVGLFIIEEEAKEAIMFIKARAAAIEKYLGDKSTVGIWDIHTETLELVEEMKKAETANTNT